MITKRAKNERGHLRIDWLDAKYTFSFGSYFDPEWMGFRSLRVINDDIIDEGMGFGTHPHRDMEIISFILEGALEHKDALGNHSVIRPGEIQIMSAGSGIEHSEFNPSKSDKTHSLQIWIEPNIKGIKPRYEQFKYDQQDNALTLIASPDGGENIAKIYQDTKIYHGIVKQKKYSESLNQIRHYWLQVIQGTGIVNDVAVTSGDGLAISEVDSLELESQETFKFLLFDMA